jgi:hypothetical protein
MRSDGFWGETMDALAETVRMDEKFNVAPADELMDEFGN